MSRTRRKTLHYARRTTLDGRPGLYIHIPFCRRKCPYCDFYSVPYEFGIAAEYIGIVTKQIRKLNTKFSSVYIGGGTPTILSPALLRHLLDSLRPHLAASAENTVEGNPESFDEEKLRIVYAGGINRLSIGVQSFRDDKLEFLGRIHDSERAQAVIETATACGFINIGIDLMYGVPGETLQDWAQELRIAADRSVKHISCYSLTCEPRTRFYRLRHSISQENVARMYSYTMKFLNARGFKHYEVSNYARVRYRCRHNLGYWANAPYVGIGPSAVSYSGGVRRKNVSDVAEYVRRFKSDQALVAGREQLFPRRRAKETAALNIRRASGIDFEEFKKNTGFDFWEIEDRRQITPFIRHRFLSYRRDSSKRIRGIALTRRGFLYADSVSSSLL